MSETSDHKGKLFYEIFFANPLNTNYYIIASKIRKPKDMYCTYAYTHRILKHYDIVAITTELGITKPNRRKSGVQNNGDINAAFTFNPSASTQNICSKDSSTFGKWRHESTQTQLHAKILKRQCTVTVFRQFVICNFQIWQNYLKPIWKDRTDSCEIKNEPLSLLAWPLTIELRLGRIFLTGECIAGRNLPTSVCQQWGSSCWRW